MAQERKDYTAENGKIMNKTKPCSARAECRHRKHGWSKKKEKAGLWPKAW